MIIAVVGKQRQRLLGRKEGHHKTVIEVKNFKLQTGLYEANLKHIDVAFNLLMWHVLKTCEHGEKMKTRGRVNR